jgi:hypothetical protein
MTEPGDDGLELLRALLERVEQKAHSARHQHRPLRFYVRRNAHRTYLRYQHGRPRCTS